jgi:cytochrome c biogenesis protein CcdA
VNTLRLLCFIFVLASATSLGAQAAIPVEFSPPEWKFGMISQGDIARADVVAINRGDQPVELTFVPTCPCLTVSPASRRLAPGASSVFALSFDSKDDEGKTYRGFIVKSDVAGARPGYYMLGGVVRVERAAASSASGEAASGLGALGDAIEMRYYYTPGCRSCEEFLSTEIPRLEASYGFRVTIERRDLLDPAAYEELAAFASAGGTTVHEIPALRLGNELLQGDKEIRSRLPGLLVARGRDGSATAPWRKTPGDRADSGASAAANSTVRLAVAPVIAAGLIDGINPCAFTTLIFLLASLALAGWGRREVLAIGSLFTLGVFITYFGVGFGLFAAIRAASAVAVFSVILRWVLVAVLAVFAALSVYDYTRIKAGKPSEILLQLPNSLKLRIHASIRTRTRTGTAALAGSSFVLGVIVSIFEFACTAQVYLPTLAYLARAKGRTDAFLLLVIYNLCFIAPLLVVFAASYFGVSSKKITAIFQKRMGAIKLSLAAVFVVLAVLTLLT